MNGPSPYITREKYLRFLEDSRDVPLIKVIIGMRRCGKSVLLEMFRDRLVEMGVNPDRIYYRKFDQELEGDVPDYRGLIESVKSSVSVSEGSYILLDEIQDVDGWERAVESFYGVGADVYITGSNANLLSSELSTKLSGRTIELEVLPLNFMEFRTFRSSVGDHSSDDVLLEEYMHLGGLPLVALIDGKVPGMADVVTNGVFNTVYVKDVLRRNKVRNEALMGNLNRFMMRNIGHRTSVRSAANYLTSAGCKTTPDTIDNYISMLESALLFHRARRRDSRTREYLRTFDKYYCNDLGVRNSIVGMRPEDIDGILENIVFMELRYRYGQVDVCDIDGKEVDFTVWTPDHKAYYQVTYDMSSESTREREVSALKALDDNYPKYIITFTAYPLKDIDGIHVVKLSDWLTE